MKNVASSWCRSLLSLLAGIGTAVDSVLWTHTAFSLSSRSLAPETTLEHRLRVDKVMQLLSMKTMSLWILVREMECS